MKEEVLRLILKSLEYMDKEQIKELKTAVDSWFATHWRNPKAEYRTSRE